MTTQLSPTRQRSVLKEKSFRPGLISNLESCSSLSATRLKW